MDISIPHLVRRAQALAFAGLVLFASGATVRYAEAQVRPAGPAAVADRPAPPQKYVCGEEYGAKICQCTGAADCVDMKNGGQCSDSVVTFSKGRGQCTWKGPPTSRPAAYSPRPARGSTALAGVSPKPQPYACKYKGSVVLGCGCSDIDDCLKLDDTKMCGAWAIEDVNVSKGSGKCGAF